MRYESWSLGRSMRVQKLLLLCWQRLRASLLPQLPRLLLSLLLMKAPLLGLAAHLPRMLRLQPRELAVLPQRLPQPPRRLRSAPEPPLTLQVARSSKSSLSVSLVFDLTLSKQASRHLLARLLAC